MHKKRILLTGTIIILSVLFLNIVFSDRSAKTSLPDTARTTKARPRFLRASPGCRSAAASAAG